MVVGILGAGRMGRTLAQLLAAAGHDVRLANSRGADSLRDLVGEVGPRAAAVAAQDIAAGARVVILATRWEQLPTATAAVASWAGTVVVDTTNPRFGPGPDDVYDTGALTSSEAVADLVPGARVVKAFNHQPIPALAAELGPKPSERNALFLAGDDTEAKALVAALMRSIGGEPIDTGDLRTGGALQASGGGPLAGHGRLLTPAEAAAIMAGARRAGARGSAAPAPPS
jgi:8-hydroxy-5-deazaflavin:NADPH oxidoreductase